MRISNVTLGGALEGRSISVDEDRLTVGMLEDLEGGSVKGTLDALSGCVLPGDIIGQDVRGSIRNLKPSEFKAVLEAVMSCFRA
jgi:hypothetical protein